jgi:hypothetical protein
MASAYVVGLVLKLADRFEDGADLVTLFSFYDETKAASAYLLLTYRSISLTLGFFPIKGRSSKSFSKISVDIKSKDPVFYLPLCDRPLTTAFQELLEHYSKIPKGELIKHLEEVICVSSSSSVKPCVLTVSIARRYMGSLPLSVNRALRLARPRPVR